MQKLRFAVLVLVLLASLALSAQSQPSADSIMSQAQAEASQQHKVVLLIFRASWCGYCRRLESYLKSDDISPIVSKYFVIARISAQEHKHPELENPGGTALLKRFGGDTSVPFFVFLDGNGGVIVDSKAPQTGNIGFPVDPGEIDWFMKMLAKAAPSMTPDDAKVLEAKLRTTKAAGH